MNRRSNNRYKKPLAQPKTAELTNFADILDDWDNKAAGFAQHKIQQKHEFEKKKLSSKQRQLEKNSGIYAAHGLRPNTKGNFQINKTNKPSKNHSIYSTSFIDEDDDDILFKKTSQYTDSEDNDYSAALNKKTKPSALSQLLDDSPSQDYSDQDEIDYTSSSPVNTSNPRDISKKLTTLQVDKRSQKDDYTLLRTRLKASKHVVKQLQSGKTRTTDHNKDLSSFNIKDKDHSHEHTMDEYTLNPQSENKVVKTLSATNSTPFVTDLIKTTRIFRDLTKKHEIIHLFGLFLGSFDILPSLSQEMQRSAKNIAQYRTKYKHSHELILRSLVIDTVTNDSRITTRMTNVQKGKSLYSYLQRHSNQKVHQISGKPLRKTIGVYGTDYDETDITLGMHRTLQLLQKAVNKKRQDMDLPPINQDSNEVYEHTTIDDLRTINNISLPDDIMMNIMLNSCYKEIQSGWSKNTALSPEIPNPAGIFAPTAVLTKDIPEASTYLSDKHILQQGINSHYSNVDFAADTNSSDSQSMSSKLNSALYSKGMSQYHQSIARSSPQVSNQLPHQHPATLLALHLLDYMAYTHRHPDELRKFFIHRQQRILHEYLISQQEDDALLQQYIASFTDKKTHQSGYNPGKRSAALYRELKQLETLYESLNKELTSKSSKNKKHSDSRNDSKDYESSEDFDDEISSNNITKTNVQMSDSNAQKLVALAGKHILTNIANSSLQAKFPAHMVFQKINKRYANSSQKEIGDSISLLKTKLLARAKAKLDLKRRFIGIFADIEDLQRERPDYKIYLQKNMLDKYVVQPDVDSPDKSLSNTDLTPTATKDGYNTYEVVDPVTGKLKLHDVLNDELQRKTESMLDTVEIQITPEVDDEIKRVAQSSQPHIPSFLPLLRIAGDTHDVTLTQSLLLRIIQWDVLFTANTTLTNEENQLLDIRSRLASFENRLIDLENEGVSPQHPEVIAIYNQLNSLKDNEATLLSSINKQRKDLHQVQKCLISGLSTGKPLSMLQLSQFIAFWNRLLTMSSADFSSFAGLSQPQSPSPHQNKESTSIQDDLAQLSQKPIEPSPQVVWPSWLFPAPQQLDAFKEMILFEGINFSTLHPPPAPLARPGRPLWPLLSPLNVDPSLTEIALSTTEHTDFWSKAFCFDDVTQYASHYARAALQPKWLQDEMHQAEFERLFPLVVDEQNKDFLTSKPSPLQRTIDQNISTNKQRLDAYKQQLDEWDATQKEILQRRQEKKMNKNNKDNKNVKSSSIDPDRPLKYEPMEKLLLIKKPPQPHLLPTNVQQLEQKYFHRVDHESREMVVAQERAQRLSTCITGWMNNVDVKLFQQQLSYRCHFTYGFLHILSLLLQPSQGANLPLERIIQQYSSPALLQPSFTTIENDPTRLRSIAPQATQSSKQSEYSGLQTREELNQNLVYPKSSLYSHLFTIAKQLTTHSFSSAYAKVVLPVFKQQKSLKQPLQLSDVIQFDKHINTISHSLFQHGILPLLASHDDDDSSKASSSEHWPPYTSLTTALSKQHINKVAQMSKNPRVQAYLSAVPRLQLHKEHMKYFNDNFNNIFLDLGSGDGEHATAHASASYNNAKKQYKAQVKPDLVIACDLLSHRMEKLAWNASYNTEVLQKWLSDSDNTIFDLLVKNITPVPREKENVPSMTSTNGTENKQQKPLTSSGTAEIARYMFKNYDMEKTRLVLDIDSEPVKLIQSHSEKMAKHIFPQSLKQANASLAASSDPDSPNKTLTEKQENILFINCIHSALSHLLQILSIHCQAGKRFEHFLQFHPAEEITSEMCYDSDSKEVIDKFITLYGQDFLLQTTPRRLFGSIMATNDLLLATPYDTKKESIHPEIHEPVTPFTPSDSTQSQSPPSNNTAKQALAPRRQLPNLFVHCGTATPLLASLPVGGVHTINLTHPPPPTHESYLPDKIDISQPHSIQNLVESSKQGLLNEHLLLLAARVTQPQTGCVYILSDDSRVSLFLHRIFHNEQFRSKYDDYRNDDNDAVSAALNDKQTEFDAPDLKKWFSLEELNFHHDNDESSPQSRYMNMAKSSQIGSSRPYKDGQSRAWRLVRNKTVWE